MNIEAGRERLLLGIAAVHALCFLVLVAAAQFDQIQILGISRWIKPAKFAISIALYTSTMAFLFAPLADGSRAIPVARWMIAMTMIAEFALILMQSFRGVPSHFNNSTPFDRAVFGMMGALIALNTLAVALVLRDYIFRPPYLHPALLSGIRSGLAIFIAGSLQGFLMVSRGAHTVGAPDGGPGLPFLNWSATHGDLRIPHFFALHALQALPLLALLLPSLPLVRGAAVLWALGFAGLLAWCFR